jgi:SAM-dependent methyltransferase
MRSPSTAEAGSDAPNRANWFETFFHGVALDMWREAISPEQTRGEVAFLEKTFGAQTRLLDVPCGNGRHSIELARRGFRVTGVDLSKEALAEARANAKTAGLPVEFIHGDMRRLDWEGEFDGAFCMGNSFGYFEFGEMIAFVEGLARALKPGGRFVIETGCAAECLLPTLKERAWYQVGDILFAIENRYLADISCLETECTFVRNGKSEVRKFWHWVHTVGEIRRLLEQAGLVVRELLGSNDGQPFKLGSPVLLIVGEKPAARYPKPIRKRKSKARN